MRTTLEELIQRGNVRTQRLVEAARQLQKERPIESIRVVDIVECAGFSVGSFYLSFESVEDLWACFLRTDLIGAEKPFDVICRYMPGKLAAAVKEALP